MTAVLDSVAFPALPAGRGRRRAPLQNGARRFSVGAASAATATPRVADDLSPSICRFRQFENPPGFKYDDTGKLREEPRTRRGERCTLPANFQSWPFHIFELHPSQL